jgi:hypothetical protein
MLQAARQVLRRKQTDFVDQGLELSHNAGCFGTLNEGNWLFRQRYSLQLPWDCSVDLEVLALVNRTNYSLFISPGRWLEIASTMNEDAWQTARLAHFLKPTLRY